jgi:uncharacterized repeat protein (TIGR01451 family)
MKARINYKSRRNIIITAIVAVLAIAATAGTVAFIKGNRNAAAASDAERIVTEQDINNPESTNPGSEGQNGETPVAPENNGEQVTPNAGENQTPIAPEGNGANTPADNNVVPADNGNTPANNAGANNAGTPANNAGRTNAGTTTATTNANVPNQTYTQTTTQITEQDYIVTTLGWTPLVMADVEVDGLGINKPELEAEKIAFVNENENETVAQKGDEITYVIKVKNNSKLDATNIRIEDVMPEGTTLVSVLLVMMEKKLIIKLHGK